MPAGKGKCRPKNSVIPPKTPIGSALLDEEQEQFPLDDVFAGQFEKQFVLELLCSGIYIYIYVIMCIDICSFIAGELPSEPSTSRGKKRGYSEGTSYK